MTPPMNVAMTMTLSERGSAACRLVAMPYFCATIYLEALCPSDAKLLEQRYFTETTFPMPTISVAAAFSPIYSTNACGMRKASDLFAYA